VPDQDRHPQHHLVYVNDQPRPLDPSATLTTLLGQLGLADRPGVAVAVNQAVVPRADWQARALRDGDRVLVIHASQGG
jgi:sulfur carrier protein